MADAPPSGGCCASPLGPPASRPVRLASPRCAQSVHNFCREWRCPAFPRSAGQAPRDCRGLRKARGSSRKESTGWSIEWTQNTWDSAEAACPLAR
eukprot:scaffold7340_cov266-Pinguiococcus_pyrenoidosus.AAC.93